MADDTLPRELRDKHVLVVNDTQEILELFTDLLGEFGHRVTLMSYAPNELTRIKQANPDLIIVDFILGGRELQGWQLVQKLKMDRATAQIPVIACTAAIQHVREQEGYLTEQGIVVLLKPFSIDQLRVAIEKAFEIVAHAMGTSPLIHLGTDGDGRSRGGTGGNGRTAASGGGAAAKRNGAGAKRAGIRQPTKRAKSH